MDEVKSVNISFATEEEPLTKEKWEARWLETFKHEPTNRQKRRRMEKDWEKYLSKKR